MAKIQPRNRYPYMYAPDGWDAGWQAAKAAAGATPAQILFWGDSVQAGGTATSDWKKSYVHLLREALKPSLGGLKSDYYPSYGLSLIAGTGNTGTPPWNAGTYVTSSGRQFTLGWHSTCYESAVGAQAGYQQLFTSPDACTALDIFYLDFTSGTWVYSIDGGADQVVTNTNGSSITACPVKKISITGLANTTHTVNIGKQSTNSTCVPMGIACHNSALTGGLQIGRFVASGANFANDYITASQIPNTTNPGRVDMLCGAIPSGGGGVGTGFGFPMQPHLLIFEMGINDCAAASSQADFTTGLRRLIQGARKGRPNASVLLHIVCNPDINVSDNTSNLFAPASWPNFMNLMYQAAQQFNCAVLNTHAKWGEYPNTSGFMTNAGNVHPTDAGHADIAADLLRVL